MIRSLFAFTLLTSAIIQSATAQTSLIKRDAPVGGSFTRNMTSGEPPTLHPIMSTDVSASQVQDLVMDTLASRSPDTGEFIPRMAEKWDLSKDGKVYTFTLREGLTFHDGKPVTAEDVKFSYDAIFEPAYEAAHLRPYYEAISKVEVVDPRTVRFTLKDTYFLNFNSVASMTIMPKHVYGDVEKSKKMSRTLVGSGPYRLDTFDRGQRIVLRRFDKWYGLNTPEWKGAYNFDRILLRFVKEDAISFEMIKKGDLDFEPLTPEYYTQKAVGEPWGKTVFKHKVENKSPKSYGFIGWNLRNELFKERNVRIALQHLLNREEMNKKFRFGVSDLATGPLYRGSEYADPTVKPIPFDANKARALLAKAGWRDTDKNGVLDKSIKGKKTDFRFSLIYANRDIEKYLTIYKEDLKRSGIDMELKYLEWNSFLKSLDEGSFDAANLAWGGSFDWDPKQIWHSSSAIPGGSNFVHYKNPELDKLIERARMEVDKTKRTADLRRIYRMIAEDAPYAFFFNDKYAFYANSNKMGKPADTFPFTVGYDYWWSVKP